MWSFGVCILVLSDWLGLQILYALMFVGNHGTYVEVYKVLGLLSIRDIHGPLDKWNQPICIPGFLSVRPLLSRFIQYFMSHKLF